MENILGKIHFSPYPFLKATLKMIDKLELKCDCDHAPWWNKVSQMGKIWGKIFFSPHPFLKDKLNKIKGKTRQNFINLESQGEKKKKEKKMVLMISFDRWCDPESQNQRRISGSCKASTLVLCLLYERNAICMLNILVVLMTI